MRLKMRNLATCYSEHAIRVSDSYCSGNSNNIYHHVSPTTFIPSIQDEVSLLYKVKLSTQNLIMFITLTWSTHNIDFAFKISINDQHHSKNSPSSFCLKKIKGSKKLEPFDDSKIELIWDLTKATYEIGPEPVKGYFVAVVVNSHELISIGDQVEDNLEDLHVFNYTIAKSSLVSRIERFLGNSEYSSRAKFFNKGSWHDIRITCESDAKNSSSLCVWIDKKNVIQVKRLRWNFRGNQTVFLDGNLVDLLWDVHDWFFDSNSKSRARNGIFLFRPRSGLDSRLWLEEKMMNLGDEEEQENVGASLLIYACKNPD